MPAEDEIHPLAAEILVADAAGRVVAATRKTSDYDQSDEDWWKVGCSLPEGGMWTDSLHFDESAEVFSLDLVLPVHRGGMLTGVIKVVLDVSPLFEMLRPAGDDEEERLEILLPDGGVLARSDDDHYEVLEAKLDPESLLCARVGRDGWTISGKGTDQERMTGFAAIQSAGMICVPSTMPFSRWLRP